MLALLNLSIGYNRFCIKIDKSLFYHMHTDQNIFFGFVQDRSALDNEFYHDICDIPTR